MSITFLTSAKALHIVDPRYPRIGLSSGNGINDVFLTRSAVGRDVSLRDICETSGRATFEWMRITKKAMQRVARAARSPIHNLAPRRLDILKLMAWVTLSLLWGALFGIVYFIIHLF